MLSEAESAELSNAGYTAPCRILIYSQDGYGLGHLRRNLNICLQIKRINPKASVLILADSPVAPFFKLPPRCDFIKLPTIVKVDTGIWRPDRLSVNYRHILKIRQDILCNVMQSFRPHILLVDHMPHGVLGELRRPLTLLRRNSPHTRIVLGLRDILGSRADIRRMWETEHAFEILERYYDTVLIYGTPQVFDLLREYRFPSTIQQRAFFCGYVAREPDRVAMAADRQAHPLPRTEGAKRILVSGGGGADADFMMEQCIYAMKYLEGRLPYRATLCVGPFMPIDRLRQLQQLATGTSIRVRRVLHDSIELMKKADLVVSMAGYNTISEIMRFRKNAIIVPRSGPSAEQTMRTRLLAGRGLFDALHPRQLTVERLAELLMQRLVAPRPVPEERLPDLNGAHRAAANLIVDVQV